MKKCLICYYSGSGNTRQACTYLKRHLTQMPVDMYDVLDSDLPDLGAYAAVVLACFTNWGGPPQRMRSFIDDLPAQDGKPAILFNTYGFLPGHTLSRLRVLAKEKGFSVHGGHSLHTPESYPPMRRWGLAADDHPNAKDMSGLDAFVGKLDNLLKEIANDAVPRNIGYNTRLVDRLLVPFPRRTAKLDFGHPKVDTDACTKCNLCIEECPYDAIQMKEFPVFDQDLCYGCWKCYNRCPTAAIYTSRFHGDHRYPEPNQNVVERLGET